MSDDHYDIATYAAADADSLLLEGPVSVGKTTVARAIADVFGGTFRRVQGTSDKLPSDILGTEIWNPAKADFEFRKGPIFSNILLVDELNRMSPRALSALIEAMQEKQVTIGNESYPLEDPFMVIATQNPADFEEATNRVPITNKDRFPVGLFIPNQGEIEMLQAMRINELGENGRAQQRVNKAGILAVKRAVGNTVRTPELNQRAVGIILEMRELTDDVDVDNSALTSRAAINMVKFAGIRAVANQREQVTNEDLDFVGPHVLRHRTDLTDEAAEDSRKSFDTIYQQATDTYDSKVARNRAA
jgi:MoxR-like ATPase